MPLKGASLEATRGSGTMLSGVLYSGHVVIHNADPIWTPCTHRLPIATPFIFYAIDSHLGCYSVLSYLDHWPG